MIRGPRWPAAPTAAHTRSQPFLWKKEFFLGGGGKNDFGRVGYVTMHIEK